MKNFIKLSICLGAGLALNAGLHAESAPLTGNPYTVVVARNIFGLLPPPPPPEPTAVAPEPPVKITLNGIMSVYGRLQALFKVAGKAPGKEDSYILSEGQRQDDIEVTKIDEKKGEVTFNNHGQEQVLPLAAPPTSTSPAPVAGVNPGVSGTGILGAPMAGTVGVSGFNTAFGSRVATGGSTPAEVNGSNLRPVPTRIPPQPKVDPVMQTIMIEANRMKAQNENDPVANIYPPTALTPALESGDTIPAPEP